VCVCQTTRLYLGYNDNNKNRRSVQHSKSSEVPSNSSSVYGPNNINQLSQGTGSSGQLKEKKNHTTHTRQQERTAAAHTAAAGVQRFAMDPGISAVVDSASTSVQPRDVHRRGTLFSDDGVVEQLTATAASSRQPRRRHPVRQRRRRRTAVGDPNYRLFVPKTFRSQERKVPMENFRPQATSPGTKVPGTFVPRNFRSQELSFLGPFVPRNFRSRGTKVPGSFRSRDLSFT